jgi:tol-pal system protein YbgF
MNCRRPVPSLFDASRALVITTALIVAVGCASGQSAQRESEMTSLRSQVEELKKRQEASAREIGRLSGEVKALDAQAAFLAGEAKAASEALGRVKATLEESHRELDALRSLVVELSQRAPATTPSAPTPTAPTSDASPEKLFAEALASFRAEEHGQAILGFAELTKRFPEHPLASNAQYWIGEAYYRQRDYQQALLEFRKLLDVYPKSPQIPEALLKIGLCYRAFTDVARAREVWEQVTKEYPGTDAAAQARSFIVGLSLPPARTGQ